MPQDNSELTCRNAATMAVVEESQLMKWTNAQAQVQVHLSDSDEDDGDYDDDDNDDDNDYYNDTDLINSVEEAIRAEWSQFMPMSAEDQQEQEHQLLLHQQQEEDSVFDSMSRSLDMMSIEPKYLLLCPFCR